MKETVEFRSVKLRASTDAGTVEGVLIAYGVIVELGRFKESFTAGCFGALGEVRANIQHVRSRLLAVNKPGGGMTLTDTPEALRVKIELPDTEAGRETAVLIGRGVLTGLSAEFAAKQERWSGRNRTILSAELRGLGIVDLPAHPQSLLIAALEARWAENRGGPGPGAIRARKVWL